MDNIKNKTVLVTGGASGLGLAYVKQLLQNGAKTVAVLDLSTSPGQASVAALEKEFGKGKALFFPCDVSDSVQLEETFKKIWNTLNGVDILINNAGMYNDNQWKQTILVNVCGVVQGTLLALDYMGKHKGGKGGTIVNIASIVSLEPYRICPVYCGTKYNILGFSQSMQGRFEKTGVRVLVMCPGITTTALIADTKPKTLDFVEPQEVSAVMSVPQQPVEVVAQAMMLLLQKGKDGSVWISEENKPPAAIEFPPCKKTEVNL